MKSYLSIPTRLTMFTLDSISYTAKKSALYLCLLLALSACNDQANSTHTQTKDSNKISQSQLGQIQASLQLSEDMNCEAFTMINQDDDTEELSIDLTNVLIVITCISNASIYNSIYIY